MVDKDFSCPVCLDILKDPVILKCSHNICLSCANSLIALKENQVRVKQKRVISCPVCRGGTYVPGHLAESLTSNVIVKNFLEQVRPVSAVSALEEHCQKCASETAVFECLACELFLCVGCEESHRETYSRHKVLKGKKPALLNVCKEHALQKDLFCMEEKVYCCKKCAETHDGHETLTVEEARRSLNNVVYRFRDLNKEVLKNLMEMQTIINKKLEHVNQMEAKSTSEIQATYDALKGKIEDAKETALQRIGKHYKQPYFDIVTKLNTIKTIHAKLKECQELEDDLLFHSRAPELADVRIQALNMPMSISLEFPQLSLVGNYLAHSYLIAKTELESSAITQLLYLSRGSRDYIMYNFETDRTEVKQINAEDLIIHRWCGFAVLPDQSVIVTGGKESKDSGAKDLVFMFYPESGQTTQLPSMLNGHSSHICLYVDNAVYVLGGKNQSNTTYSECEVYDVRETTWTAIAAMALSRTCASGAYHKGKIYVFGGYQAQVDDSIEVYNIASNAWTLLAARLPEKVWQHASVGISDSQVLIFGGESGNEEANTRSYIFDLETMTFHGLTQMPIQTNWLFFWLHVAQRGSSLFAMSKEMQVLRYSIPTNEWINFK